MRCVLVRCVTYSTVPLGAITQAMLVPGYTVLITANRERISASLTPPLLPWRAPQIAEEDIAQSLFLSLARAAVAHSVCPSVRLSLCVRCGWCG